MSLTSLLTLAVTSTPEGGVSKWVVGGGIFLLAVILMGALLAFGGGRRHS